MSVSRESRGCFRGEKLSRAFKEEQGVAGDIRKGKENARERERGRERRKERVRRREGGRENTSDRSSPHGPVVRWPFVIAAGRDRSRSGVSYRREKVLVCDEVRRSFPRSRCVCFLFRSGKAIFPAEKLTEKPGRRRDGAEAERE